MAVLPTAWEREIGFFKQITTFAQPIDKYHPDTHTHTLHTQYIPVQQVITFHSTEDILVAPQVFERVHVTREFKVQRVLSRV